MATLSYVDSAGSSVTMTFVTLGMVAPSADMVQDITRENVDGKAYRYVGKKGTPQSLRGMADFQNTGSTTVSLMTTRCLGAKGRIATVVDDHGVSWPLVMVLDVRPGSPGRSLIYAVKTAAGGLTAGLATHVLDAEFTVEVAN